MAEAANVFVSGCSSFTSLKGLEIAQDSLKTLFIENCPLHDIQVLNQIQFSQLFDVYLVDCYLDEV